MDSLITASLQARRARGPVADCPRGFVHGCRGDEAGVRRGGVHLCRYRWRAESRRIVLRRGDRLAGIRLPPLAGPFRGARFCRRREAKFPSNYCRTQPSTSCPSQPLIGARGRSCHLSSPGHLLGRQSRIPFDETPGYDGRHEKLVEVQAKSSDDQRQRLRSGRRTRGRHGRNGMGHVLEICEFMASLAAVLRQVISARRQQRANCAIPLALTLT